MSQDKVNLRVALNSADIARTLARMAHEITEKNPDISAIALVGIITRGAPLARRMAEKLSQITGVEIPVGKLDVTFYRDDLARKGPSLNASPTDIPFDISGKTVILVDDVLFTGRTIRSAIDAIMDMGRPGRIQLAALLDRGHRELPIRADYIGKNIPTSRDELVKVRMREIDGEDAAIITGGSNE